MLHSIECIVSFISIPVPATCIHVRIIIYHPSFIQETIACPVALSAILDATNGTPRKIDSISLVLFLKAKKHFVSNEVITSWQRCYQSLRTSQLVYKHKLLNVILHSTTKTDHSPQYKQHIFVQERYRDPFQSMDYPTQKKEWQQTCCLTSLSSMMMAVDAAPLQDL